MGGISLEELSHHIQVFHLLQNLRLGLDFGLKVIVSDHADYHE